MWVAAASSSIRLDNVCLEMDKRLASVFKGMSVLDVKPRHLSTKDVTDF